MSTLKQIFERLQHYGVSLALDKCDFGQSSVDYLGFNVSTTGIRPLQSKIEALKKIPQPSTQKELLKFLGGLNYFRQCLGGLYKNNKFHKTANLLQPLYSAATNARIFRETKSRDRKFPDRTFQDRKILGPENSRNSIFSRNSRNIFLRKFQDFFLPEQKIPGLLTLLNSRTKNSVTEFSRTFLYIPEPF